MRVPYAAGKPRRLHGEDFLRARSAVGRVLRHKGVFVKSAHKRQRTQRERERNGRHRLPVLAGGDAATVKKQAFEIHLGTDDAGLETLTLREDDAVFADEVVSGKDKIGGGLALAGVRIDIGAGEPCGLHAH